MENNIDNIPDHIFDWVKTSDFNSLTLDQQERVLKHLSEETYIELHQSAAGIKSIHEMDYQRKTDSVMLNLLARFDNAHASKQVPAKHEINSLLFWKAAAVLLMLACTWMFYGLRKKNEITYLIKDVDTLYIAKQLDPIELKVFDTIYLDREIGSKKVKGETYFYKKSIPRSITVTVPEGINILSIKDINSTANKQKRNSLKADSLMKKYSVTTL